MTWATVITGPDGDAPEQRRQPVGWEQGWGGGDWQLRLGGHQSPEEEMGMRAQRRWERRDPGQKTRWQGSEEIVRADKEERRTRLSSEQKG